MVEEDLNLHAGRICDLGMWSSWTASPVLPEGVPQHTHRGGHYGKAGLNHTLDAAGRACFGACICFCETLQTGLVPVECDS